MDWQNAIFAPGWVWSMLSMVFVVGSLVGLYRQLRLQSSRAAIDQLNKYDEEWETELYNRHRVEILSALMAGVDAAHLPDGPVIPIAGFWEKIGSLVRAGHIDPKLLWNASGRDSVLWWTTIAPYAQRRRTELHEPAAYEHFEWLAGIMGELDRRAGYVPADMDWVMANMERRIAMFQDMIRVQQSLRTVITASPDAVQTAPRATANPRSGP